MGLSYLDIGCRNEPQRHPREGRMSATTTVGVRYMIDDVADAMAFYTTHLGFTLEQDAAPAFAAVSRDGVRLLLSGPTSSGRRPMPDAPDPSPAAGTACSCRSPIWPPRSTGSAPPAAGSATTSSPD